MKKPRPPHIVAAILSALLLCSALAPRRSDIAAMSFAELKANGLDCVGRNVPDSALMYFLVAGKKDAGGDPADLEEKSAALNNAGHIYSYYYNDYSHAYACLLEALELAEEAGTTSTVPYIYLNLANIYGAFGDYPNAISRCKKAFACAAENADSAIMDIAFLNMAVGAVTTGRADSLVRESAIVCGDTLAPSAERRSVAYLADGILHLNSGRYADGLASFGKARDASALDTSHGITGIIAKTYALCGDYDRAISSLKELADSAKRHNRDVVLLGTYEMLAEYYSAVNQPDSALQAELQYLKLKDKIAGTGKFGQIKDFQATYDAGEMSKEIRSLNDRHARSQLFAKVAVAVIVVVTLLLLWVVAERRRLRQSYNALYRKNVELIESEQARSNERARAMARYAGSSLDSDEKQRLAALVCEFAENSAEIYSPSFTIDKLAAGVDSNSKYVSQVINEVIGMSFSSYISERRIREACRRISDTAAYGNISMDALALGVGFKSYSNFVATFKKVTGLTPSQYKKNAIGNNAD